MTAEKGTRVEEPARLGRAQAARGDASRQGNRRSHRHRDQQPDHRRKQRPSAHVARRPRRLLRGPAARPHPRNRGARRRHAGGDDPQRLWRHRQALAHHAGRPRIRAGLCRRPVLRPRSTTGAIRVSTCRRCGSTCRSSEYILDAGRVEDPEAYYEFLERPPVERVERLYSVDEVKRSARIRDKTPRVELDTVTFEFGSASIAESEVPRLQGVADAMERLLKKNPAETFLIEGHTDAVGSDVANLALSDRRAESVADALTNVFGIPPENLGDAGLWRALPEDQDRGARAAQPPRRDPPDHAAGRPGGQRQLSSCARRSADTPPRRLKGRAPLPRLWAGFPALSLLAEGLARPCPPPPAGPSFCRPRRLATAQMSREIGPKPSDPLPHETSRTCH